MSKEEKLEFLCNEMLFQLTGKETPKEDRCEKQGDVDWQIAMHYLKKVSNLS